MPGMWYQNAVLYGIDIRRFQDSNGDGFGDIQGLISRLDYLAGLGVDALWLLPFFATPLRDNGYDVIDYYQIDPRVGTLDDFVELVSETRRRGIRLVIDLVMNHTSDQHPWFQAARRDPASRYRSYYVWTDQPPQDDPTGDPIFPGVESSVWRYDPLAAAYYYHRFYHFQPELCIANPEVQAEIFRVVDFWLSLGVSGFRFDAAPIMLERKGLPGTEMRDPHQLFRDLHTAILKRNPEAVLLGEANLEMEHMDEFFGGGSEMNLLFNFQLGPHLLLALAENNAAPMIDYLERLLVPPESDEWVNFLRNLDELSIEVMAPDERQKIYAAFAPQENMRIYERGLRRRLAPILAEGAPDLMRARQELAFSLCFSFPGIPMIMYGDEIGMGEDLSLPERNSVRLPMQWSSEPNGGFSTTAGPLIAPPMPGGDFGYATVNVAAQQDDPASLLTFIKKLIAAWQTCPELGQHNAKVFDSGDATGRLLVHGYDSLAPGQHSLMMIHNLSGDEITATAPTPAPLSHAPEKVFGSAVIKAHGEREVQVRLPAYGYIWLRI